MIKDSLKNSAKHIFANAVHHNLKNIDGLLPKGTELKFCDLGCDEGSMTQRWARVIGTDQKFGVELVASRANEARTKGIQVQESNLNQKLPYLENSFDVITANQVIEHIVDTDLFLEEISRVLKPGGVAIISTENASSWANVFSTSMGWQMFSHTNFSKQQYGIGNPLALHRGEKVELSTWTHIRIFSFKGLWDYFSLFGLEVEEEKGAGYFPLPTVLANVDVRHAHFITFKVRKEQV